MTCKPTRLLMSVTLVALLGCNSSGGSGPDCSVSCPSGTRCDGDRCLPICFPPCLADEYCGTDSQCHQGHAPDGNVITPLDSGPLDAGSGDSSSAQDQGQSSKVCACVAQQPKQAHCVKQAIACSVAADCCVPGSSLACGSYGNKFSCVAGSCQRAGCASDAECVAYATSIQAPQAQNHRCLQPACPGQLPYCGLPVQSCQQDSDCCLPSSGPCGTANNRWSCVAGSCTYLGCQADSECVGYAQQMGYPDPQSYGCFRTACWDTGFCSPKPKPCNSATDCCDPGSSIPCGIYGNRYRCEAGGCVFDSCGGETDCQSYVSALGLPDPADYHCVTY